MSDQLKRIFRVERVTYDRPGDSQEQEGLFIDVQKAMTRLIDGRQIARVEGKIHIFVNSDKIRYGFFSKALAEADPADASSFFFHDFEENKGTFRNIAERALSFVYFFDSQFDPAIGTLTEINLEISES
jgi:hypothetical protein